MDKFDIELKKHKFITFSEDHYNPLGVLRSLGEMGLQPIAILIAEKPCLINHCKYIHKLHVVRNREEGLKILLSMYGNEEFKPFLFCSDDITTSFLDAHYDELIDKFYFYNAGEKGRITWLQNKDNITNLGAASGLSNPNKEIVNTGILPKTLKYPIITKVLASTMGAWKGDVYVCNDENELKIAYSNIKSPKLILQEYIHKKGEFCMEGFAINEGQDIFIPYEAVYLRYYDDSYGHYMKIIPFENLGLKKQIQELFIKTKYNGIFEIEFMKGPHNENYFLEVNFRASTWNYAITVGGGNLPYYWALSTLLGRIPYEDIKMDMNGFTAMVEPDDLINNVLKSHQIKIMTWFNQLHECKCLYYFNKKDPLPAYYYWGKRIINILLKPLRFKI